MSHDYTDPFRCDGCDEPIPMEFGFCARCIAEQLVEEDAEEGGRTTVYSGRVRAEAEIPQPVSGEELQPQTDGASPGRPENTEDFGPAADHQQGQS